MLDLDVLTNFLATEQIQEALSYFTIWVTEKDPQLSEQEEEQLLHILIMICESPQSFGAEVSRFIYFINAAFYRAEESLLGGLESRYPANELIKYCLSLAKSQYLIFQFPAIQNYLKISFSHSGSLFRSQFMQDPEFVRLVSQYINLNQFINLYGESILQCAVREASEEVFRTMIECSADVNGVHLNSALRRRKAGFGYDPIAHNRLPAMNLFSDFDDQEGVIEYQSHIHPRAQLMMQAESSMDFNPLQLAIIEQRNELVIQLLAHQNIRVESQTTSLGIKTDDGDIYRNPTALMMAAYVQNIQACQYLVQKGAHLDAIDNAGETALMYAARAHDYEIIALLLKSGANFKLKNLQGLNFIDIMKAYQYSKLLIQLERFEDFFKVFVKKPEKLMEFIQKRIEEQPYEVVPVLGDGNCLYHALALYLPYSHEQLRLMAADFIEAHPEIYKQHIAGDFAAYVERIRAGAWGDHLEIDAIYRITGRPIVLVYANNAQPPLQFGVATEDNPAVHLQYNNINHYDGLIPAVANPEFIPQMSMVHLWKKYIKMPEDARIHISSYFSLETVRKVLSSYENILEFFMEWDLEQSSQIKPK